MRCPAGLASHAKHSGGAGAPPGPKMRPCQELAVDPLAYTKRGPHNVDFGPFGKAGHLGRKRGPVVVKSPRLARREAPRVSPRRDAIGLRFSARHPLIREGRDQQTPDASRAAERRPRVC